MQSKADVQLGMHVAAKVASLAGLRLNKHLYRIKRLKGHFHYGCAALSFAVVEMVPYQ